MALLSSQLIFVPNDSCIVNTSKSSEWDTNFGMHYIRTESQMNDFSNILFSQRLLSLNQLIYRIQQNSDSIQTISKVWNWLILQKLDVIDEIFETVESELSVFEHQSLKINKDEKESTEEESGPCSSFKKQPKLHYKDLFRERMFGVKQYRFRLNVQGNVPQTIYKERNLSLKINLVDCYENMVPNGKNHNNLENAISLHLKVFYSNGE